MTGNREQMAGRNHGISLIETVTALVILGLISSGVFVVVDRCIASASDTAQRVRAFEVARENMESLLTFSSVREKVEYGVSEKYPDIHWAIRVESFYDSPSSRMWVKATCSAEYIDSDGENQEVVLTHWLTDLSEQQARRVLEQQQELARQAQERGDVDAPDESGVGDTDEPGQQEPPTTEPPGESGPDSGPDMERPPNIPPELWEVLRQLFE